MNSATSSRMEDLPEPEISVADGDDRELVGERFGKYLIVGEVATGGMAEVFLGVQRGLEGFTKVVVLKRVMASYSENEEFVRMFVDEARLAARLEHPNIVRTYEFGEVNGQYFTAMEYLPGEDLNKVLNKTVATQQSMPLHAAAKLVAETCRGLHFAHELTDMAGRPLGLVHRDVNPANIVLTYGGEVKLIDFGVAKTKETKTVAGTIKGKIAYMAPEQLLARGIDRRSDVFSTGVVLWELLTGRPLFIRDSEAATLYAIMNDPIRPPSRYRADVPPELDEIVMRALSRTPADRYDTAEDMATALDQFLALQPPCDAKALGALLMDLFGPERANAKKSISQTRSLGRNISLVMKLRSEVRADLAEHLESLAQGSVGDGEQVVELPEPSPPSLMSRAMPFVWATLILACIGGGVFYLMRDNSDGDVQAKPTPAAQTSLVVESTPAGAMITLGGEPTGMKTPATLTGITMQKVTIGLALAGHESVSATIDLPEGGKVTKRFELVPSK